MKAKAAPGSIDQYIAAAPEEVRPVLEKIRATIRRAVPDARETISYRLPTFKLHGVVLHFGAFKEHVGLFPPVDGDPALMKETAPYAGPKGNLQFPLDRRIPYALIAKLAKTRAQRNRDKAKQ